MAAQFLSILIAILIYPLLIWVPGAALGYAANLFNYRERSIPVQLALGLLISVSCLPIVIYLLARTGGFHAVWAMYGVIWVLSVVLAVMHGRQLIDAIRRLFTQHRGTVLFIVLLLLAGALLEVDWISPTEVRANLTTMDQTAHVAITDAITRTGVPPVNPFVYPGHPVRLLYYYGWYLFCSLADQLGGSLVTARSAVQAGKAYVGLSVVSVILVYLELLGSTILPGVKRIRAAVGIALLLVTGLDLLPWSLEYLYQASRHIDHSWMMSIEWWNEQVPAWVSHIFMAPHHGMGLVICMTGLLMLMTIWEQPSRKILLMALASLAFASAAAVSAYVALAFGAGLFLWMIVAAVKGWWADILRIVVVGVVALVLYAPVGHEVKLATTAKIAPITLTVREFSMPEGFLHLPKGSHAVYLLRLVLLPLNYFLELGFFIVAAVLYWLWRRSLGIALSKAEWMLACLAMGSVLVCTFLRSNLGHNDLGWRGFVVAQFVLLLWSVPIAQSILAPREDVVAKGAPLVRWRAAVALCLLIGFAGSLFEIWNFRTRFQGPVGPQTVGAYEAYEWIDHNTPKTTVVLFNPDEDQEYFGALYGHRQLLFDGKGYGFHFGGVPENPKLMKDGMEVFSKGETIQRVLEISGTYHVGTIVVLSTDPAWKDDSSWVWKVKPTYETPTSRVYEVPDVGPPAWR